MIPRKNLVTERLVLEPVRADHAGAMWHAVERSLPELRKWMAWAPTTSPIRVAEFTARAEAAWTDGVSWEFVATNGNEVAGTLGINRYDEMWRAANLGYWVRSDLAGRGLATEAAAAVASFGFDVVGIHRLELVAAVDNIASQRVAEKLGFVREGIKRGGSLVEGASMDVVMFGLLTTDPRPRQRKPGNGEAL